MQFDSLSEFFAMGGYGFYVWMSFVLAAIVLIALLIQSLYARSNAFKQANIQHQRAQRIKQNQAVQERNEAAL